MDWTELRARGRMGVWREVAGGAVVVRYRGAPIAHVRRHNPADDTIPAVALVAGVEVAGRRVVASVGDLRARADMLIPAMLGGAMVVVEAHGAPAFTLVGLRQQDRCPVCGARREVAR